MALNLRDSSDLQSRKSGEWWCEQTLWVDQAKHTKHIRALVKACAGRVSLGSGKALQSPIRCAMILQRPIWRCL